MTPHDTLKSLPSVHVCGEYTGASAGHRPGDAGASGSDPPLPPGANPAPSRLVIFRWPFHEDVFLWKVTDEKGPALPSGPGLPAESVSNLAGVAAASGSPPEKDGAPPGTRGFELPGGGDTGLKGV